MTTREPIPALRLPQQRGLYYGGNWHEGRSATRALIENPSSGETLAELTLASDEDVEAAIAAARSALCPVAAGHASGSSTGAAHRRSRHPPARRGTGHARCGRQWQSL